MTPMSLVYFTLAKTQQTIADIKEKVLLFPFVDTCAHILHIIPLNKTRPNAALFNLFTPLQNMSLIRVQFNQ